jgi:hypothetical protein
MLPVFGRPRRGPNPLRSHRDAGSSQQFNVFCLKLLPRRTACRRIKSRITGDLFGVHLVALPVAV